MSCSICILWRWQSGSDTGNCMWQRVNIEPLLEVILFYFILFYFFILFTTYILYFILFSLHCQIASASKNIDPSIQTETAL